MIEAQGLRRSFGDFTAVDGVSFRVDEGEILGMLGPNGAGKTTTLRMITGFLPPSAGRVTVGGKDLFDGPSSGSARREIGYLPESVALYPEMRVQEYLRYRARLEGLGSKESAEAITEALEHCLLEEVAGQIIGTLSKGYRQRVGLAAAILHRPGVLVLDEPTVGLDPKQIIAIRELIRRLGRRRTLLLSTHILPEVELLCDRIVILDGGRIVDQGSPADLRRRWVGAKTLRVTLRAPDQAAAEAAPAFLDACSGLDGVHAAASDRDHPASLVIECKLGHDPREEIFRLAVARGWVLLELSEEKISLEDVFVRLTTRDLAEASLVDPVPEDADLGDPAESSQESAP